MALPGTTRIVSMLALVVIPFGAGAAESDDASLAKARAERIALIERILAVIDIEKQRDAYIAEWMDGQDTYYPRILAERLAEEKLDKKLARKVTKEIADASRERYLAAWRKKALEELPIHKIYFDAYSAAFNPHFTVEELRTLVEFLETPVGTTLLDKMFDIVVAYLDARVKTTELAFREYTDELLGAEVELLRKELGD